MHRPVLPLLLLNPPSSKCTIFQFAEEENGFVGKNQRPELPPGDIGKNVALVKFCSGEIVPRQECSIRANRKMKGKRRQTISGVNCFERVVYIQTSSYPSSLYVQKAELKGQERLQITCSTGCGAGRMKEGLKITGCCLPLTSAPVTTTNMFTTH